MTSTVIRVVFEAELAMHSFSHLASFAFLLVECSADGFGTNRPPFSEDPNILENQFLCRIFDLYNVWHCKVEACAGISDGFYDPSSGAPVYGSFFVGVPEKYRETGASPKGFQCLLEPFHDDICPSDEIACNCDQNFLYVEDPPTGTGCNNLMLNQTIPPMKTPLVEYCEALLGFEYRFESKKGQDECIIGCTRYFSAEGYACCGFPKCDCGPAEVSLRFESVVTIST